MLRGEDLNKINFKVRFRNPAFWLGFIPAVLAFIYSVIANFTDVVPAITENDAMGIATTVITALTALGVLVDPTSKGISDCPHCRELEHPEK